MFGLTPFKICMLNNFPFIENTIYELDNYGIMCKIIEKLNEVTNTTNEQTKAIETLRTWFNNLDVQDEINNKLDEMVQDGSFSQIVGSYITNLVQRTYNTLEDMIQDETIVENMKINTLGYFEINDGGNASYYIKNDSSLIEDGGSIIDLNNGLKAILIANKTISPKIFGAKGDNSTDDTIQLQKCLDYCVENKKTFDLSNYIYLCINGLKLQANSYIDILGNNVKDTNVINSGIRFVNKAFYHDGTSIVNININIKNTGFYTINATNAPIFLEKFKLFKSEIHDNMIIGFYYFLDGTIASVTSINNNQITKLRKAFIYIESSLEDSEISGNYINMYHDTYPGIEWTAIFIGKGGVGATWDVEITNNYIDFFCYYAIADDWTYEATSAWGMHLGNNVGNTYSFGLRMCGPRTVISGRFTNCNFSDFKNTSDMLNRFVQFRNMLIGPFVLDAYAQEEIGSTDVGHIEDNRNFTMLSIVNSFVRNCDTFINYMPIIDSSAYTFTKCFEENTTIVLSSARIENFIKVKPCVNTGSSVGLDGFQSWKCKSLDFLTVNSNIADLTSTEMNSGNRRVSKYYKGQHLNCNDGVAVVGGKVPQPTIYKINN